MKWELDKTTNQWVYTLEDGNTFTIPQGMPTIESISTAPSPAATAPAAPSPAATVPAAPSPAATVPTAPSPAATVPAAPSPAANTSPDTLSLIAGILAANPDALTQIINSMPQEIQTGVNDVFGRTLQPPPDTIDPLDGEYFALRENGAIARTLAQSEIK